MHSRDATDWCRFDPPGGARVAQREVDEFERLEATHPHGVSAAQIVDFFAPRGVKLAQATFRKYVQLGLLPRSRRVAENGEIKASRRRELERMLNGGRHKAHQFVKDIERTVSQITARQESGKGDR